jgi:hypothetical protein
MPSMSDSGLPSRQRWLDWAAAARAVSILSVTNAPTTGSRSAKVAMQRYR